MKPKKEKVVMKTFKLPSYLIIAEARCGTTSLYKMMTQHPQIVHASRKELYFLINGNWRDMDKYKVLLGRAGKNEITGEATPSYMWKGKMAIPRILRLIPKVKFIIILRNPIDKVYSHFMLRQANQKLTSTGDLKLFIKEATKYLNNKKCNEEVKNFFERAKYYKWLKLWLDKFPRKQFKIIKSEDFYKNPIKICNEIFDFLKLKPYKVKSRHSNKLKYPKLHENFKKRMRIYFKPYNKKLYKLLNRNFNWENMK